MEEAVGIEKENTKCTRKIESKDLTGECVNMLRTVPGTLRLLLLLQLKKETGKGARYCLHLQTGCLNRIDSTTKGKGGRMRGLDRGVQC